MHLKSRLHFNFVCAFFVFTLLAVQYGLNSTFIAFDPMHFVYSAYFFPFFLLHPHTTIILIIMQYTIQHRQTACAYTFLLFYKSSFPFRENPLFARQTTSFTCYLSVSVAASFSFQYLIVRDVHLKSTLVYNNLLGMRCLLLLRSK